MTSEPLRILLLGSGGREHALAWKLGQSSRVEAIYVFPGNGGTESSPKTRNITWIDAHNYEGLVQFALHEGINLVAPSTEQPLVDGIGEIFQTVGIPFFGPGKAAAQLEGSKAFSSDFMQRHRIPCPYSSTFHDYYEAKEYVENASFDVIIKASGLTKSKGVVVPLDKQDALNTLQNYMVDNLYGEAGTLVVVEEALVGREFTVVIFSDGRTFKVFSSVQDYKTLYDGDKGVNTGGMGSYAPTDVSDDLLSFIKRNIIGPTIQGMEKDGIHFIGVLSIGLILAQDGPKVIDYDVRFGDPETQSLLPLLKTDLAEIMVACIEQRLDEIEITLKDGFCVTVVVYAKGYPGSIKVGKLIQLDVLTVSNDEYLFHSGTAKSDGQLYSTKGRVLAFSATGTSLEKASTLAYKSAQRDHFEESYYRTDIGKL